MNRPEQEREFFLIAPLYSQTYTILYNMGSPIENDKSFVIYISISLALVFIYTYTNHKQK